MGRIKRTAFDGTDPFVYRMIDSLQYEYRLDPRCVSDVLREDFNILIHCRYELRKDNRGYVMRDTYHIPNRLVTQFSLGFQN